eukprot:767074-Hanusia_phi.AAC.3
MQTRVMAGQQRVQYLDAGRAEMVGRSLGGRDERGAMGARRSGGSRVYKFISSGSTRASCRGGVVLGTVVGRR